MAHAHLNMYQIVCQTCVTSKGFKTVAQSWSPIPADPKVVDYDLLFF